MRLVRFLLFLRVGQLLYRHSVILSIGYSSKPYRSSLPLSIRVHHIKGGFKNKNMRRKKNINSQQERTRCEERRKQMRVAV